MSDYSSVFGETLLSKSGEVPVSSLNGKIVGVYFSAHWCGPCRQLIPVLEEVSKEMAGKVEICKMNVDESPNTAAQYGIRSIPTLFLFKDGKQIDVKVGLNSKSALEAWIDANA